MRSCLSLLALSSAVAAHAGTTWISTGAESSSWADAVHWSNGMPIRGESVVFGSPRAGFESIDLAAGGVAGAMSLSTGYLFHGGSLSTVSLLVSGTGSVGFGVVGDATTLTTGSLALAPSGTGYGSLFVDGGSRVVVTGTGDSLKMGRMSLSLNASALETKGNASIDGVATLALKNAADAHIGGDLTLGSALHEGHVLLDRTSNMKVDGSATVWRGDVSAQGGRAVIGKNLVVRDSWTQAGGSLSVGGDLDSLSYHGRLAFSGDATLAVGGDATIGGLVTFSDPKTSARVNGDLTLAATGILQGETHIACQTLVNGGILYAGDTKAGTIAIDGDLVDTAGSATAFLVSGLELGTPTGYSRILVDGDAALDGMAFLDLASGASFRDGDRLSLVATEGSLRGVFSSLAWSGAGSWALSYDAHNAYATFVGDTARPAVAQAVPEPTTLAVLGLGALGLMRRRRAR